MHVNKVSFDNASKLATGVTAVFFKNVFLLWSGAFIREGHVWADVSTNFSLNLSITGSQ